MPLTLASRACGRNWAGDQRCEPAAVERPAAVGEVVGAVERAVAAGRSVRVAGAGHRSPTPCSPTARCCAWTAWTRARRRSAQRAGPRRGRDHACTRSARRWPSTGWRCPNLGDIDEQTIAGAIATATHGTGARCATSPRRCARCELVTGDGRRWSSSTERRGRCARRASGLGALGVVTAVTLRCVPAFTLRGVDAPRPLARRSTRSTSCVDGNDHFEFFVFPHADAGADAHEQPHRRAAAPPRPRARLGRRRPARQPRLRRAAAALGRRVPGAIPPLNRLVTRVVGHAARASTAPTAIFASPRLVRFTEMEYALPREHAAEAVRGVLELIDARGFAVASRSRCASSRPTTRCSARRTGATRPTSPCTLFEGMAWEPYFRAVEAIMDELGGRPHWGKRHFQTAATLAPRYPEWERFAAVRARLDPDGPFRQRLHRARARAARG